MFETRADIAKDEITQRHVARAFRGVPIVRLPKTLSGPFTLTRNGVALRSKAGSDSLTLAQARRVVAGLKDMPLLVVSDSSVRMRHVLDAAWLLHLETAMTYAADLAADALRQEADAWGAVMIDAGSAGSPEDILAVVDCAARVSPSLPVLLLAEEAKTDLDQSARGYRIVPRAMGYLDLARALTV